MIKQQTKQTEIPEGWEEIKFEDLVLGLSKGRKPEIMTDEQKENYLPYLSTDYLRDNGKTKFVKLSKELVIVSKEDIVLLWDGSNAGEFLQGKEGILSSTMVKFNLKEGINKKFLFPLLRSKQKYLQGKTNGTGIPHVDKNVLMNLRLLVPKSLLEQRAIARILSTVDEAIQKVEDETKTTLKIKNQLMKELLDIKKVVPLNAIFNIETGTTPSTKVKKYWENVTINWLTPVDLGNNEDSLIIEGSERKISEIALKEVNLTLMPKETIVISTRAPVGYVKILKEESTFNQGCKGLIPKDSKKINPYFYGYYLVLKKYFLQNKAGQSTFKEISKKMFEKFEVPDLNINEQDKIAEILSTIDKKLELQKVRKEILEKVKKGLMNELLTGKKRVNVERVLEAGK